MSTTPTVGAPINPLRGLAFDADAIARYMTSIEGPVLVVGHSDGGAVAQPEVAARLICPRVESQHSQLEDGPCR